MQVGPVACLNKGVSLSLSSINCQTVFYLGTVLTACAVVAVHQPEATSLALRRLALSRRGTIDRDDGDECACRCGSGSVRGGRSRRTAVGTGRASPCGYAAVSGSSWCTCSVGSGAASAQRSTAKLLRRQTSPRPDELWTASTKSPLGSRCRTAEAKRAVSMATGRRCWRPSAGWYTPPASLPHACPALDRACRSRPRPDRCASS